MYFMLQCFIQLFLSFRGTRHLTHSELNDGNSLIKTLHFAFCNLLSLTKNYVYCILLEVFREMYLSYVVKIACVDDFLFL